MDELDLLKKDWNKENTTFKNYSDSDIYPMLQRKSSSIVKTLFYISIAELVFWIVINSIPYVSSAEYKAELNSLYGNDFIITALTIISYVVILIFIYLLFKSYKSISVVDDAKTLMKSILKTRKVIKWYVIYNLVMAFASLSIGLFHAFNDNPELSAQLANFNDKQLFFFAGFILVFTAVFVLLIWLFYKLIYGILLKRLNKNYEELKKLEV
jgi:uncharacterized membrane protein